LPLCSSIASAVPPEARPAEEPIRLEYRPVAGCPSKDALITSLRASTPRFRFAAENEPARSFAIDAEEKRDTTSAPRYAGRLTIRDVSGQTAVREVTGETCAEAVAALAFVAALAIDPNAVPTSGATAARSEAPVPSSPSPSPEGTLTPSSPLPLPASPAAPLPEQVATSNAPAAEAAPAPRRGETRFSAALRGGLITGVAPNATGMGRLSVELSRVTDGSLWSPSVALSVARGATQELPTESGTVELTWTTGRLDACVFRVPVRLASPWEVRLGPFFEAGVLAGRAPAAQPNTKWLAIGGVGRFALTLAGPVSLEAEASLGVPIFQYDFHFEPSPEVYTVPLVSFSAAAGIAVRFW
jgi:hypothetical protein